MKAEEFRRHGHQMIDWIADYLENAEKYPVMSQCEPGAIRSLIPAEPPRSGESMDTIMADFHKDIMPGITHWNHPSFFAYFPANNSGPSILGELMSAGLGINAMSWQTSPAATELEERVMQWLGQMIGLPDSFSGVIQDTASTATLCALLCAREKATNFESNAYGATEKLSIYTSREAHSSIVKGAKIAGFGQNNVVLVDTDDNFAMDPANLEAKISADIAAGHQPCCIVATVGTTSSTSIDPVPAIAKVACKYGLWLHIDAALAGTAAIVPEMRWILDGCDQADSLVFNPHKWLFTNFDCSAFFVRDATHLQQTLAINPEYLKTNQDQDVHNYRDWGIQLGRRFRALKLWFVLRHYGVEHLQQKIVDHLKLAQDFAGWVGNDPRWELMAPVPLNTVCFRAAFSGSDPEETDRLNKELMDRVNAGGKLYLTHTRLHGKFTMRLAVGQTETKERHVQQAWDVLNKELG
jgi:aromatic-L-amino-acid/L-tryptophan decarboxylase